MTVRVAVVGAGRQGRNHLRSFSRLLTCAVTAVVDTDTEAAKAAAEPFGARSAGELGAVLDDCDAVVVAVPSEYHLDATRTAMAAGKHVLVEKPIGATLGEAAEFVALAAAHPKIVTMVGHVERFNPVVRTLLAGDVKPIAAHFERVSPYTPRIAESVVNDLLIHDADIALRLVLLDYPPAAHAKATEEFDEDFSDGEALKSCINAVSQALDVFTQSLGMTAEKPTTGANTGIGETPTSSEPLPAPATSPN